MPCRCRPRPERAAEWRRERRAGDKRLCRSAFTGIIARMKQPAIRSSFAMLTAAPAIRRWFGAASLGLLLAVPAGCMPGQRLAGLDSLALSEMAPDHGGETWLALPMDRWRGSRDGLGKPRAVIACLADDCRNRLAAAVFELEGEAARLAERDLRDPQALLRSLESRTSNDSVAVAINVAPLTIGELSGFEIALQSETGPERSVYGAGLGRREGRNILVVVLAIGDDPQVVRAAAAQVQARAF